MKKISLTPDRIKVTKENIDAARTTIPTQVSSIVLKKSLIVDNVPWEKDGYYILADMSHVNPYLDDKFARPFNAIERKTPNIRIDKVIADFYLLDALQAGVPHKTGPLKTNSIECVEHFVSSGVRPIHKDNPHIVNLYAMFLQAKLVNMLAPILRDYMHYAIASELSYHPVVSAYFNSSMSSSRKYAVINAWSLLTEKVGGDLTAEWAKKIFLDGPRYRGGAWNQSFGGNKWAQAAEIVRMYETGVCNKKPFTKKHFLDRVFNTQHNTGTILNKVEWNGLYKVISLLDSHHCSDYSYLLSRATSITENLWITARTNKIPKAGFKWKIDYPKDSITQ